MTNAYFTKPADLAPVTKARSVDINTLSSATDAGFDAVAAAFTSLNGSLTAKGNVAGQAWTGAQDFTGATITVPTRAYGSSGAYAVSMDALNAAVFAAANLPGQGSNAFKFLITNGTTPSWSGLLNTSVIRFSDSTDATKLLAFNLAGLATGTTRTLTAPSKDGTVALVGDSMALLAVLTPTAAAAVNALNVFSSTYDSYMVTGEGVCPASNATLVMQMAVAGALVASGSPYSGGSPFASISTAHNNANSIPLVAGANTVRAAGTGINFTLHFRNMNSASNLKSVSYNCDFDDSSPGFTNQMGGAEFIGGVVTGFGLSFAGAINFKAQGTIRIYGIQKA